MSKELNSRIRRFLLYVVSAFFIGIYIGATTIKERNHQEMMKYQTVARNCLETIIGIRPGEKICPNTH